ncbi:MAG: leucine-rich repeat protein, partial [Ruminococcus sp.]|nr:leucine-rich repeat protein [Ruminococcus sp.]
FDIVIIRPGVGELSENSLGSNAKIIYLESYNCVIPDSETAIPADARILGYTGSTAQAYAEKYGREFKTLSGENEEYPLMEGVCTENLKWILWDDGSLAFYGYGDIVAENGVYPWDRVADSIKEVIISTAVKSIDENAFTNCTNLESVLMYTPDCKIADSADVFPSNVLLQVGDNSTAEEYAVKYNLTHVVYNFFTASGEIGDNLTWVLFNGGSLRIYGEGDMIDLGGVNPWGEYEDEITRVQINEEVTSIDKSAFEGCDNIAEMIVLNPECKFAESEDAIPEDTVIYAAEGSGALMYAQLFGRSFKTLSSEITAPEEEEESYIAYGELGENLTWKLLDDGMLEINGEGEMLECGEGGYPWSDFSDKIKDISLAKEVTSVGAYAFYNCKNLETLHLAPVVGAHAYDGCSNVTVWGFYEDLTINEIGDYAFNNCGFPSYEITNPECVIADSEFVFPAGAIIEGYVGSTAQAHAEKYGLEFVEITSGEQEIVAEGMCGENVSWAIYEDEKSLIISGEGEMANWETTDAAPWAEYSDFIEAVCINDGVKSIGENSFDALSNIWQFISYSMDCVIPDSDTAIPENAEILCYNGSTAQAYAEKYGRTCVFMGEIDNDIIVSGELGENLSWNIQTDGYLNVFGNGDMIEIDGVYPWDEYAEQITEVFVSGNVTSISAGAFDDCVNASDVYVY